MQQVPYAEPVVIDRRTPKPAGRRLAIGSALLASLAVVGGAGYYLGKPKTESEKHQNSTSAEYARELPTVNYAAIPGESRQQRDDRIEREAIAAAHARHNQIAREVNQGADDEEAVSSSVPDGPAKPPVRR